MMGYKKVFTSCITVILIAVLASCAKSGDNTPTGQVTDDPADITGFAAMLDLAASRESIPNLTVKDGYVSAADFTQGKLIFAPGQTFDANYFTISASASSYLRCELEYKKGSQTKIEEFFLEGDGTMKTFRSYMGQNNENAGKITLVSLYVEDGRRKPLNDVRFTLGGLGFDTKPKLPPMLYLENEYYKVGINLEMGGGISYLQDMKNKPALIKEDGIYKITLDQDHPGIMYTGINLLSRADAGRSIQQSYYGGQNGSEGYEMGEFIGMPWGYNPVQGGDKINTPSKIIDYEVTDTYIYVKCRPMDWGQENKITPSYMENTITFIDNVIKVENRFIDFSKYIHKPAGQELPAFYSIEPLRTLWYYPGSEKQPMAKWEDRTFWATMEGGLRADLQYGFSAWTTEDDTRYGVGLYNNMRGISILAGMAGVDNGIGASYDGLPEYAYPTGYTAYSKVLKIKNGK
ncbi:MAG TPA: hypothetical protein PLZ84_04900, partial [Clostridia bacterium]|nr:hypothetical protein [Clostridia bacterium]